MGPAFRQRSISKIIIQLLVILLDASATVNSQVISMFSVSVRTTSISAATVRLVAKKFPYVLDSNG